MLIPRVACSRERSNELFRKFAIFVFIPTSAPTRKNMPNAIINTNLFFNKLKQDLNVAGFSLLFVSSILVKYNQATEIREVMAYTAKTNFQLPNCIAKKVVIIGPRKDVMDLINWDKLIKLENFSFGTTFKSNGLAET